jgi:hypothetical protein
MPLIFDFQGREPGRGQDYVDLCAAKVKAHADTPGPPHYYSDSWAAIGAMMFNGDFAKGQMYSLDAHAYLQGCNVQQQSDR